MRAEVPKKLPESSRLKVWCRIMCVHAPENRHMPLDSKKYENSQNFVKFSETFIKIVPKNNLRQKKAIVHRLKDTLVAEFLSAERCRSLQNLQILKNAAE